MGADKKKSNFRSKKKKDVKTLNKKKKVMDMTLNRHEQYSRSNYLLESQYWQDYWNQFKEVISINDIDRTYLLGKNSSWSRH